MIPRSGGEKVYLEAVYTRPKYLATVIFAMNAILLGFTASGCIVSVHTIIFVWDLTQLPRCSPISSLKMLKQNFLTLTSLQYLDSGRT